MKIVSGHWGELPSGWSLVRLISLTALLAATAVAQSVHKGESHLTVSVIADKREYRLGDKIAFEVLLTNQSNVPVYLYAYLARGESASLSVWFKDVVSGKVIPQTVVADSITPPPPSKNVFVQLLPWHVYGVVVKSGLADFGVEKEGKYQLMVQYHSPVPSSRSFGLPIWSAEDGPLSSDDVTITVRE